MRGLIGAITVLGAISSIAATWWNLAMRKRYYDAKIKNLSKDTVESGTARWARRILTGIVLFFLGSALITGGVIFIKTLWELFS